jgi:hypothetical protein
MKTLMVKSWFLRLAYQVQAGGATDCGCLDVAEPKVQHLHEELEAPQRSREELTRQEAQA